MLILHKTERKFNISNSVKIKNLRHLSYAEITFLFWEEYYFKDISYDKYLIQLYLKFRIFVNIL